ncbi:MAG: pyruvate kinase, partial [Planctomycetes bacterium]|nr:pyruvate kinase [Planctomycetota bacterium]
TRAEATDVANAILDGADACMLSGETAIGEYPRESVEMMHRIALATEALARERPAEPPPKTHAGTADEITEAITFAAGQLAEQLEAPILIVASVSGNTALTVSKHRLHLHVLGTSDSEATLRKMCLYWGVVPVAGAPVDDDEKLLEYVVEQGRKTGHLSPGEKVVLVSGTGLSTTRHKHIVVHQIE